MRYFFFVLSLLFGAGLAAPALAQTQLDPSFQPLDINQVGPTNKAIQTSSGARVLLGAFERAAGRPCRGIARYLPNGQFDATFHANVQAMPWTVARLTAAPGDKLLVFVYEPPVGYTQVKKVLRLNPDGTVDPSFTPFSTFSFYSSVETMLMQPDGKVLLAGTFLGLSGPTSSDGLLRLNADGTPDTAFMAAGSPGVGGGYVTLLALQADGKLLMSGSFTTVQGVARPRLARLNASGSLDATFAPVLNPAATIYALAVQPNGYVLASTAHMGLLAGGTQPFVRLTPTGGFDPTFQPPADVAPSPAGSDAAVLVVQPDGRVLVGNGGSGGRTGTPYSLVARLLATGQLDPSWAVASYGDLDQAPRFLQLLATGQVLLTSAPHHFASAPALPTSVALLAANGSYLPTFLPALLSPGYLFDMKLQPDGRILLAGQFCEINGTPARSLARLLPNGAVDVPFTAACPLTGGRREAASGLALQPDGKVLVGGYFGMAGGLQRPALARLLPSGQPDASFTPPLLGGVFDLTLVERIALQPDGQVLAVGLMTLTNNRFLTFVRYDASGQLDASFNPVLTRPNALLVQPDGNIVAAGGFTATSVSGYIGVARLLPSGSLDPAFAITPVPGSGSFVLRTLARQPDGRLLVGGLFAQFGGQPTQDLARLTTTGQLDPTLQVTTNALNGGTGVTGLAVQPNGRLLVGGTFYTGNTSNSDALARLLPDGSFDPSLDRTQLPRAAYPNGGEVSLIQVQPDGRLLVGGTFVQVAGQPRPYIARLLDANVLGVAARPAPATTQAWPIPAHGTLHLALDGAAAPRRVALLDALGREVLAQAVAVPTLTLNTTNLAAGPYLLRVDYATGPVLRWVVVE